MSSRGPSVDPDAVKPLDEYTGRDRYVDWIDDYLGVLLTEVQKEIIYTIQDNQRVLIVSGNGVGKTYTLACFSLAYLFVNYPTSVLATSGTYQKLRRTYCRPVNNLHSNATVPLPGEYLRSNPPRIRIPDEPEVFWEASSSSAGELEGVHNEYTLAIVEEADKAGVTPKMFDSLSSLLTDANDKLVAVANPPRSESNIVYKKMEDPNWVVVQPSSFDAHNVQLEMNHPDPYEHDADGEIVTEEATGNPKLKRSVKDQMIPEMVTLSQIRKDWNTWNNEPWPGAEAAMHTADRDDLDVRWYRRRLGVIPPKESQAVRPFTVEDVETAFDRDVTETPTAPAALGWDVARGAGESADYNALAGVFGDEVRILDYWRLGDHVENEQRVRSLIDESAWRAPLLIDAVGEGSGAADRVSRWYPATERFNASGRAIEEQRHGNRYTEGLIALGEVLREGGSFESTRLREELMAAARSIELSERYHAGTDTTRFHASSKDSVRERIGRSPDLLDAAVMAAVAAEYGRGSRRTVPGSF